jgi:hypothetical protein
MQVARWYCPTGHTTFSLLPDCLASRLSGTLDADEEVVAAVDAKVAAGSSIERPHPIASGSSHSAGRNAFCAHGRRTT